MNYVTFQKHAAKLTKKVSNSRPALQGMHHMESAVVCTDSHRLYRLNQAMPGLAGQTINPNTGATIDCNYPDTSRLFPESFDKMAEWELKPVIAFLKAVKSLKIPHVIYENGLLSAESKDGFTKLSHEVNQENGVEATALDTVYLLEACELMFTSDMKATFLWNNRTSPVVFRDYAYTPIIEALVLPIRLTK